MNDHRQLIHPRDQIMQTMDRIYRYRMTTTSGGNLSIRDDAGDIWISPARIDKGNLKRDDIVRVRADGSVEGPHRPSSEFPFHKAIFQARPDVRAIVHAHPVALVAFSICGQTPNTRLFHQAHSVCGTTGFAPYALPGSEALGRQIANQFSDGCDSVVLENHGVVVAGESLSHAFQRFEAFEFAAKTIIKGRQLGAIRHLTDMQLEQAHNRSVALESFVPKPASTDEMELRRQLCEFIRRGCRQRLLISTEGSFSARLGDNAFVITPTLQDRERLEPADLVLIENGRREQGYSGGGGRRSLEWFIQSDQCLEYGREAVRQALVNLEADPAQPAREHDRRLHRQRLLGSRAHHARRHRPDLPPFARPASEAVSRITMG